MASIEAAIRTRLLARSGLTDLVGQRIYPHEAPQGAALPYVVFYGETTPEHHMGGCVGLAACELSIDVVTDGEARYRVGKYIVTQIRGALDGYRGIVNVTEGTETEQVDIRTCLLTSQADAFQPPIDGGPIGRYAQSLTFSLGFLEAIPS